MNDLFHFFITRKQRNENVPLRTNKFDLLNIVKKSAKYPTRRKCN